MQIRPSDFAVTSLAACTKVKESSKARKSVMAASIFFFAQVSISYIFRVNKKKKKSNGRSPVE